MESETDMFLVYSLYDLKLVYQKQVNISEDAIKILINSQNEVFVVKTDGIYQLDVLLQF